MQRVMAHCIVYGGVEHRLSILTLSERDGLWHVSIEPFVREVPGTVFVNGRVELRTATGDWYKSPSPEKPVLKNI